MRKAEAILTYGMSGWPVWVHHARRDLSWRVLEIVEPEVRAGTVHGGAARGGAVPPGRYLLKVHGPLAYVAGYEGTFYIAAERDGDRWWIEPDAAAYPRRGTPPGR
jgi:hypothetical protein